MMRAPRIAEMFANSVSRRVFPMPGGPSELGLQSTAWETKWNEAFIRREGGKEKADALQKRFGEMVLQSKTDIVMKRFS